MVPRVARRTDIRGGQWTKIKSIAMMNIRTEVHVLVGLSMVMSF